MCLGVGGVIGSRGPVSKGGRFGPVVGPAHAVGAGAGVRGHVGMPDWKTRVCPQCGAGVGRSCVRPVGKSEGSYEKVMKSPHDGRRGAPNPQGRNNKLTEEGREAIAERLRAGFSVPVVAAQTGWSVTTVRRVGRVLGLSRGPGLPGEW